jgi:hypothetical protein
VRQHWSLDDIESSAGEAGAAAARHRAPQRSHNREPSTRGTVLHERGRCRRGDPCEHDWPGKADDAPHPRVLPEGPRRHPVTGQRAPGARDRAAAEAAT